MNNRARRTSVLSSFLAVVMSAASTRAAKRLSVSTPGLSHTVRRLESRSAAREQIASRELVLHIGDELMLAVG
jgi:hypothetical protein